MENKFEYCRELDSLHFTSEQKARLTAQIRNATENKTHATRHPVRRMVLVAAAIVAVLAVGGGAIAMRMAGESFLPIFGTAHTEIVNKIGRPIDAGVTDDGITVTADAIIGDKYNAFVIFTVKREDGSTLGLPTDLPVKNLSFEQSGCDMSGRGGAHGASWFTDSEKDDNTVRYIETISSDDPLVLENIKAKFHKLQYFDNETNQMKTLSDGTWKLKFEGNYADSSISLPTGETFTQSGMNFKVTGICVSSVALRIEYEVDNEVNWGDTSSEDGREPEQMQREEARYLNGVSIILTKKDGSTLDLTNVGGSINPANGKTTCVKSGVFEEIIPSEDMKSISIGGVDIPINAG